MRLPHPRELISATVLLRSNPDPSEDDVRIALSGNLCRCTGYERIVRAVRSVAASESPSTEGSRSYGPGSTPSRSFSNATILNERGGEERLQGSG